ncbi:type II toxin-antitoxin system mRNA interferase toxin, RelE/StbE family [Rickettsia australis]|uniref:Addiction module toxin, RelE/StbE family protein n=1 Tax=Rickettsia australis (strain Cutlack) TaxID=1105110 RepID=H8K793_RICAC|nr:type II toxin-antitoxin system mRNA interferase toxin, RelE/StbE family [Rickettsia australis]AFC71136.1 hypothetical protein MC5_04095 [Rickettsia australis str. Cutlack]
MLVNNIALPQKYRPHKLIGNHYPKWECHIEPDWLLIYEIKKIQLFYIAQEHMQIFLSP